MIEAALPYVIVFAAMFALDFVWAYYTRAIQRHAALPAALWAVGIIVLGGIGQIGYVNDPVLLIPAALGAFGGTFAAIHWSAAAKLERARNARDDFRY